MTVAHYIAERRSRCLWLLSELGLGHRELVTDNEENIRFLEFTTRIDDVIWIFTFELGESIAFSGDEIEDWRKIRQYGRVAPDIGSSELRWLLAPPTDEELLLRAKNQFDMLNLGTWYKFSYELVVNEVRPFLPRLSELLGGRRMEEARRKIMEYRGRASAIAHQEAQRRLREKDARAP